FQAEDGIRYRNVTGVQTCALPILARRSNDPQGLLQLGNRPSRIGTHSRSHPPFRLNPTERFHTFESVCIHFIVATVISCQLRMQDPRSILNVKTLSMPVDHEKLVQAQSTFMSRI